MDSKAKVPFGFNQDYLKRVKKDDFVKAHKHLADLIDLPAEWDKVNKKEPKLEKEEK